MLCASLSPWYVCVCMCAGVRVCWCTQRKNGKQPNWMNEWMKERYSLVLWRLLTFAEDSSEYANFQLIIANVLERFWGVTITRHSNNYKNMWTHCHKLFKWRNFAAQNTLLLQHIYKYTFTHTQISMRKSCCCCWKFTLPQTNTNTNTNTRKHGKRCRFTQPNS